MSMIIVTANVLFYIHVVILFLNCKVWFSTEAYCTSCVV